MSLRIKTGLVTFAALFMALVMGGTAMAQDAACSRVFNKTTNNLGVRFHTANNTWADQTLAPGTWQGEITGNKYYEPRYIKLTANRCIEWHFNYASGNATGTNTSCAGTDTTKIYWISIYFGDGYVGPNYDVVVTRLYVK